MPDVGQLTSSVTSLLKEYDTISNNLANVSTAGFKRTVNSFSKQLDNMQKGGSRGSTSIDSTEIDSKPGIDFSQGNVSHTGRQLDLAICGEGFFTVETPEGPLYTRNGDFTRNKSGQLVDMQNNIVSGQRGPIIIPGDISLDEIVVSSDGNVSARGNSIGKLRIIDWGEKTPELKPAGNGRFAMVLEDQERVVMPQAMEQPLIRQGYQEKSNVNVMEEMVQLINVSRMYESNMKLLTKNSDNGNSILSVAMG